MKKILLPVCFLIIQVSTLLASDQVKVYHTSTTPLIDGVIDECWANVTAYDIDNDFQYETPSVTAYWKALWDEEYIYVLLRVEDDDHWPSWVSGGSWYEYDQTEIYLDINDTLVDGRGVADESTGHYQAVGKFADGDATYKKSIEDDVRRPAGFYAYTLDEENYTIEYAMQITSMVNSAGDTIDDTYLKALDSIGFDVTIVDQDEGETESRQRAVWENEGGTDESYVIMDDCGSIKLVTATGVNSHNIDNGLSVFPNPANDIITVSSEYAKLELFNQLGKRVMLLNDYQEDIDISKLQQGIYIVKTYNKNNDISFMKLIKN